MHIGTKQCHVDGMSAINLIKNYIKFEVKNCEKVQEIYEIK